jgi:hypothetical protein
VTITVVQSKKASGTLPVTVTLDAAPTAGNMLFAVTAQPFTDLNLTAIRAWPGTWTNDSGFDGQGAVAVNTATHRIEVGEAAAYTFDSRESGVAGRVCLVEVSGIRYRYTGAAGGNGAATTPVSMSFTPAAGLPAFMFVGAVYTSADGPATPLSGVTEVDDTTIDVGRLWVGYQIVASASGSYDVGATPASATDYGLVSFSFDAAFAGSPGVWVDWDGAGYQSERVRDWTITRGASPELTGGSSPGSASVTLVNTPDDRYNPENAGGPLDGLLNDGPPVWIGVNNDGTVTYDAGKTVYGLHAGRITDISVLPEAGAAVAPFVEMVTADPFEWASRQKVSVADSTTRSQADLRAAVLGGLDWSATALLPAEPTTLPLSSADGLAMNVLDALNGSNGTRHFAKPEDSAGDWFRYVAVRRTDLLDGTSDASLDAAADHVTGTSGWRRSSDGVINQQRATVDPVDFPARVLVWEPELVPITVTGTLIIWANFSDYVDAPELDYASTGSALTPTLEAFGHSAKLTLDSAGTTTISRLQIFGWQVERGPSASVVIDDLTSQAQPRGVRAGPDLSGDYLGTLTSAKGFAEHIVWRFGSNLYRPTLTVKNWFPEMFTLDLFDRIAVTVAELSVTARIFEIVGLTLTCDLAALSGSTPVVHHTATYVLQESRVQTPTDWFTWDVSDWNGADVLAY